ncbi:Kinesin-like protein KIF23 [Oopsacas minuta]|uniref:Kinesin-like protein KIF23 n=1 Tax=Oopsacas minuta TaxID=111878 RepID=A0AAV7KFJ4_9METZ|nr:Kinesin-like protein KIF23 [Oopsacas minuta]
MAYVRRSVSDCMSLSDSSSDLSSSETDLPVSPAILSLYRRELTDKRTEISELREQLNKARLDNLRLERALTMRQLNSYELESDLKETRDKLSEEKLLELSYYHKPLYGRRNYYNWEPPYYKNDEQSYIDKNCSRDYPITPQQPQISKEPDLVKPLTYHKRVISPGKWITHSPFVNDYYGLFQPKKTKGKQVTQPTKRNLVGRQSRDKYVLNHQLSTPDGSQVVTTLYKGNINPTRSGGAQVRFTDTEVLHQQQGHHHLPLESYKPRHKPAQEVRFATLNDIENMPAKPSILKHGILKKNKSSKQKLKSAEPKVRFATIADAENDPSYSEFYRQLV